MKKTSVTETAKEGTKMGLSLYLHGYKLLPSKLNVTVLLPGDFAAT